jgi:hypothetical protein
VVEERQEDIERIQGELDGGKPSIKSLKLKYLFLVGFLEKQ